MFNTRIAPSPTGDMHIGTARTAYFNWLAARASCGKFYLRIDDTDQNRNNPEYTKVILDTMDWLGLYYNECFYQSSRFNRHMMMAESFIDSGCAVREDGAVKLKLSSDGLPKLWTDSLGGEIAITPNDVENTNGMVLIKSDGTPSYNWSSVIDDIDYEINFVIRGVDHISNTSKQVILYSLLKAPLPKYAHVGLICVKNKPMSKRDAAASMLHYKNAGYDSDAMLNFLARMGWGPIKDDKSTVMLPVDRMIELFLNGGNMRSAPSNFDLAKLESFDRKYKAKKGVWRTRQALMGDSDGDKKSDGCSE